TLGKKPTRHANNHLQISAIACQNFWNANEIVGSGGEDEEPLDQFPPAMPGLAQAADRLHPAERLFDPLSLGHANSIAGMAGRAPIDRRTAVGVILCDMCRAAAFTTTGDEVGRVIILVATHGAAGL